MRRIVLLWSVSVLCKKSILEVRDDLQEWAFAGYWKPSRVPARSGSRVNSSLSLAAIRT